MNDSGRAFAQFFLQAQPRPGNARRGFKRRRIGFGFQRVTGVRQPSQARQRQQPLGKLGELIGGDADQLKSMAVAQALRQTLQLVAGEHELLQVRTFTQLGRQFADLVVGQDQPAQQWRQGGGGHIFDGVGLETDHRQRGALTEAGGQFGELVVRAEQHAQAGQAMQIIRQAAQGIAAEVEHFQRVRQVEDFPREFCQAAGQVQTGDARQLAGAQLCEGIHGQVRY